MRRSSRETDWQSQNKLQSNCKFHPKAWFTDVTWHGCPFIFKGLPFQYMSRGGDNRQSVNNESLAAWWKPPRTKYRLYLWSWNNIYIKFSSTWRSDSMDPACLHCLIFLHFGSILRHNQLTPRRVVLLETVRFLSSHCDEMTAFCDLASVSMVEVNWRFSYAYCLHRQCDGGSKYLRNVGKLLLVYPEQHHRRQSSSWDVNRFSAGQ